MVRINDIKIERRSDYPCLDDRVRSGELFFERKQTFQARIFKGGGFNQVSTQIYKTAVRLDSSLAIIDSEQSSGEHYKAEVSFYKSNVSPGKQEDCCPVDTT